MLDATLLVLPDLKEACQWPVKMNPHFDDICECQELLLYPCTHCSLLAVPESSAWSDSFGFFSGPKRQHFIRSATQLLASYAFPYAGREELRVCCDTMSLFWIIDEMLDDLTYPQVCNPAETFIKAFKGELHAGSAIMQLLTEWDLSLRKDQPNLTKCAVL